ncbi:MAG: thiamine pyrophosphate-dependent enzyme [Ardenticatenia bacterium]|nr:thiamine pyrophosphate-dependent enzyme [Ardenticatenia bacterium]
MGPPHPRGGCGGCHRRAGRHRHGHGGGQCLSGWLPPLLVIGGAAPRPFQGKGALQEMEQVDVFKPITKWSAAVPDAARIPEFMARAFRVALDGRPGPVFLEMAFDLLGDFVSQDEVSLPTRYRSTARRYPDPSAVHQAAEVLREARRPVLIAGTGAYWDGAGEVLGRLAERVAVPVYLNGMARGLLSPDHPSLFVLSRGKALKRADVVIVIGTSLDFRLRYGQFGEGVRLIQVEPDGTTLGHNRDVDVGIIGDAAATLAALDRAMAEMGPISFAGWRDDVAAVERELAEAQAEYERLDTSPINHFRLAREIEAWADDTTTLIGDGGDVVAMAAKVIRPRGAGLWLDPGPLGCLGVGQPFALAAKKLRPDHKVLVISGDGSFGFNGFELDTALRHGLPFVTVVGNDAQWGQIRNPQVLFFGEARAVATQLAPTRYDLVAEALGGHGELVESPAEIRPALERAFASGKPAVINVALDPKGLAHLAGRAYVL